MQSNKSCVIVEQYLAYLITIKGRSPNTILEYRLDLLQFFRYVADSRGHAYSDFSFVDLDFIRSIYLGDMYASLAYCQETLNAAPGTRYRKIVSVRQFWKYLKAKAHLIDNNIAEELETPKLPKRNPRILTLEESVRLLIQAKSCSARNDCIITIFLNCALRLSELASLNIDQVDSDVISIIGKGNKERKIYLTPAVKQSLAKWLSLRSTLLVDSNALFISRNTGIEVGSQHGLYKTLLRSISLQLALIQKVYPPTSFDTPQLHSCTNMGV